MVDGGIPAAEITFRTPAAAQSIAEIAQAFPNFLVGAGTVLTVRQAEEAVSRAEEEAAALEAALADPDTYQDAEKAARLAKEYQQKKDEIDRLYQAWETLESEA